MLPDIRIHTMPERAQCPRASAYISGNTLQVLKSVQTHQKFFIFLIGIIIFDMAYS